MSLDKLIAPGIRRFLSGQYYRGDLYGYVSDAGSGTNVLNMLLAVRFTVSDTTSFDRIGIYCITGAANSSVRFGVYRDDGSGQPGQAIFRSTAGNDTTASDLVVEETVSVQLTPDIYWLAWVFQGGTPTVVRNQTAGISNPIFGVAAPGTTAFHNCYSQSGVTDDLPAMMNPVASMVATAAVWMRAA